MPADSQGSFWTRTASALPAGWASAGLVAGWQREPLVYRLADGHRQVLIEQATQVSAIGAISLGRALFSAEIPTMPGVYGPEFHGEPTLCDVAAEARLSLLGSRARATSWASPRIARSDRCTSPSTWEPTARLQGEKAAPTTPWTCAWASCGGRPRPRANLLRRRDPKLWSLSVGRGSLNPDLAAPLLWLAPAVRREAPPPSSPPRRAPAACARTRGEAEAPPARCPGPDPWRRRP